MRIFKYTSNYADKILRDKRIKISLLTNLNDPFEGSPNFDPSQFSLSNIKRSLKKNKDLNRKINLHKEAMRIQRRLPSNAIKARDMFASLASRYLGFFCASAENNSILMWSHYAAQHQGIVIEFDSNLGTFSHIREDFIFHVNYRKEKPFYSYLMTRSVPKEKTLIEEFKMAIGTKSSDWSYEDEIRIIIPRSFCEEQIWYPIDPISVRNIYFGARINDELQLSIKEILKKEEYSHVGIIQMSPDPETYSLNLRTIREEASG